MFKRIRINAGNTLQIILPYQDGFNHIVRAHVTKGSGTPIARFVHAPMDDTHDTSLTISPDATLRMSGTYKYEISASISGVVKTLQYGILEVL